eukprot:TRINITY_DN8_c1_g1_i1.p1 TRINITY_DN8_c1_g1~~TRINITY_DN8_c1_g1_i1.p1  ORF type:complete len:430 (-),score=86.55 TRINITY_DN8_c1_g1_i1:1441-2730(-)
MREDETLERELIKLKKIYEKELITKEDYDQERKKVLEVYNEQMRRVFYLDDNIDIKELLKSEMEASSFQDAVVELWERIYHGCPEILDENGEVIQKSILPLRGIKENFDRALKGKEELYVEHLPKLHSVPKFFKNEILIRDDYLEMFKLLQRYDKENLKGNRNYGLYVAGPNGIGKSMGIYALACFAHSLEWLVLYLPDCDDWCSYSTPSECYDHILKAMLYSFYPHRDYRLKFQRGTLGDAVSQALFTRNTEEKMYMYTKIMEELGEITEFPVLLVFNETNAVFTTNLAWDLSAKAYQYSLFLKTVSTLNILKLNRGLKVLSGTGHSRAISHLARGCEYYIFDLSLPSIEEYAHILLETDILPATPREKLRDLKSAGDETGPGSKAAQNFNEILTLLVHTLNTVPRDLRALVNFLKIILQENLGLISG